MPLNPHSLRAFVTRWLDKARRVRTRDGLAAFDKFMFTYIAFNTLYNTGAYVVEGHIEPIANRRWSQGGLTKPPFARYRVEKERASTLVIALGGDRLREAILRKRRDIEKICSCFYPGNLYLHELPDGYPDYASDQEMVSKIKDGDITELFVLIYKVRCNLFHGEKALDDVQSSLLTSCRNILATASEHLLCAIEFRVAQR